jgi:hypothetical protein
MEQQGICAHAPDLMRHEIMNVELGAGRGKHSLRVGNQPQSPLEPICRAVEELEGSHESPLIAGGQSWPSAARTVHPLVRRKPGTTTGNVAVSGPRSDGRAQPDIPITGTGPSQPGSPHPRRSAGDRPRIPLMIIRARRPGPGPGRGMGVLGRVPCSRSVV